MKAVWHGKILAESDDIVTVEGNAYFPEDALNRNHIVASKTTTFCPWKGVAHYYTLSVDGIENPDACWFYPEPKVEATMVKGRVAFWKGVEIVS